MGEQPSRRASNAWLLLAISVSWVGVAQLARAAEKQSELVQRCSVVPLMTWANASAWVLLAIPHMARRAREAASGGAPACQPGSLGRLVQTEAFSARKPPQFLVIALSTNLMYIAALHFLPASLNTALFCTSPIFTLLLSTMFLRADGGQPSPGTGCSRTALAGRCAAALRTRQAASVALSVLGVGLIAEPWHFEEASPGGPGGAAGLGWQSSHARLAGASLSLMAAFGTAIYQVYFKATFGDSMGPEEVGLFLAHMGAAASVLCGALGAGLMTAGVYRLQLHGVPWELVAATALSSAVFNYLIKFGLSRDSPIIISLATQIGIPLNLLLDVAVVHANVDAVQAAGTLLMAASFALQHGLFTSSSRPSSSLMARLLGGAAGAAEARSPN